MITRAYRSGILLAVAITAAQAQLKTFKPGFNLFSKEQDIQLGKEAAAQVEQQMPLVRNQELQNYIERIGRRLASQPEAGGFPYSFKVVNNPEINAFALPGGPTFVNSGLIKAADNEAQLAGVLAHEISHVALRHGTHQASKANLVRLPAALAGAVLGQSGSMLGQLGQLGIGLGANSLLLRYSRDAESQADLLGAQIMSKAGYNPIEMARFFEKLEAQGGHNGPQFLSDHPNPGNRVKAVSDEIRYLPQRSYDAQEGNLARMKAIVAELPPPPKAPATGRNLKDGEPGGVPAPSRSMRRYQSKEFSLSYPDNWEAFGDKESNMLTIAPRAALAQDQNGSVQVGLGLMVSYYFPQSQRPDLQRDTEDLIRQLQRENPGMDVSKQVPKRINVDGSSGLATTLFAESPYRGETEHDTLVTVARPEGLFYMIFISPSRTAGDLQNTFESVLRSVRFSNS